MYNPRKIYTRLVIGMAILSTLGWLACAGKAPSAIGLICNKNGSSTGAKCWGKGVTCSNGYCRESETKCPAQCKNDKDCRSKMNCGDKINCNDGLCEDPKCDDCEKKEDCDDCGVDKEDNFCEIIPGEQTGTCQPSECKKNDCKGDRDCAGCGENKTKCVTLTKRCVPDASKDINLACPANNCPAGLTCKTIGRSKFCTVKCNDQNTCPAFMTKLGKDSNIKNLKGVCIPSPSKEGSLCAIACAKKQDRLCRNFGLHCCPPLKGLPSEENPFTCRLDCP